MCFVSPFVVKFIGRKRYNGEIVVLLDSTIYCWILRYCCIRSVQMYLLNRFTGSGMHCVCLCMHYCSVQWLLLYCVTTDKCLFVYCSSVLTPVDQPGHQHKENIPVMLHLMIITLLSSFLPLGEFTDVLNTCICLAFAHSFSSLIKSVTFWGISQTILNQIHRHLICEHFLLRRRPLAGIQLYRDMYFNPVVHLQNICLEKLPCMLYALWSNPPKMLEIKTSYPLNIYTYTDCVYQAELIPHFACW